jgi:hypothetical protein
MSGVLASMASRLSDMAAEVKPGLQSMAATASTLVSDGTYFEESTTKFLELRTQLDSKFDKDRLEAMKYIIAVRTQPSVCLVCLFLLLPVCSDVNSHEWAVSCIADDEFRARRVLLFPSCCQNHRE